MAGEPDLVDLICRAYDAGRQYNENDDDAVKVLTEGLRKLGWTPPPSVSPPSEPAPHIASLLQCTAHWPPLTDDDLACLAATSPLGSVAAVEIMRLRASRDGGAGEPTDALRQRAQEMFTRGEWFLTRAGKIAVRRRGSTPSGSGT